MRIGLDGFPLSELKTGVGNYTFELARALAVSASLDEFQLISPRPYSVASNPESTPPNLQFVYAKPNPITRHWWSIGLPLYARRNSLALFHGTNFEIPVRGDCPTVLTVHDLSLLRHSNTHNTRAVWRGRLRLPLMARKATMIITPSELVKNEVCERLKIESGRVVAVPLAPGPGFSPLPLSEAAETLRRLTIEDNFLLFVGTIEPRKNLLRLIQAFELVLRTTQLRPQLVLVGRTGWKTNELMSYLPKSDAFNRIRILGYLSDEDLRALYSSCRAFIYPSIYEGFGLPPLEAMACRAPVIASSVPSMLGSTGKVARIVSSEDIDSLSAAIVELLTDDFARDQLSESGFTHASSFSWERTAALTREVYEEALRRGR